MVAAITAPTEYATLVAQYGKAAADVRRAHQAYRKADRGTQHAERAYREAEAALFLTDEAACGYVAHGKNETDRKDRRTLLLAGKATICTVETSPDDKGGFTTQEVTFTHPGLLGLRQLWDTAIEAKDDALIELEYARDARKIARFALVGYLDGPATDAEDEEDGLIEERPF